MAIRMFDTGLTFHPIPRKSSVGMESIIGRSPAQVRRLLRAERQDGPTWEGAVESFARAASRIQRMAEEADSSAEAKVMLEAARAILATPTGMLIWARRRSAKT